MTFRAPLVVVALALLVGGVAAIGRSAPDGAPPALPANPSAALVELVHARPFVTLTPFEHAWRAGTPRFDAGWLVVLSVADRALLAPRQVAEPVLFGGAETLQRINVGDDSGYLVAILPSGRDAAGAPACDLARTPFFFGEPALPESVDLAAAQAALAAALDQGVGAPGAATLAAAVQEQVSFADLGDVMSHAADLVEQYSPLEVDLVSGLRVPRLVR